ncbi:triose-phosphate isomerase [Candidatus Parcubacteria bacterium]|nr:triose-phosphate isomerase [Candidatus Parcubacteria bacterium]
MKPLIVANWKMNPQTMAEAKQIFDLIKKGVKNAKNTEVVICPPFVFLSIISNVVNPRQERGLTTIKLGAQDVFWENPPAGGGAFTGEISAKMLKNLGCEYVIIGHSERRKYFKETDETINKKLKSALENGLKAILCIDKKSQIKNALKGIARQQLKNLILAYEPIFAIGTGKACSIEKAREMNFLIRKTIKTKIKILYGGSVNSQNASDFVKKAKFHGLLIGKASLEPKEFVKIIETV